MLGTRVGMVVLDMCAQRGIAMVRIMQMISDPRKGPMPEPLSINITYPVLGIIGPLTGAAAVEVGHVATEYNVPLMVPLNSNPKWERGHSL